MHLRTQIREAAQAALEGNITDVGLGRCYLGRHYPINIDRGAALAIHAANSRAVRADVDLLERQFDISVVLMISGGNDFEDRLDVQAAEVEQILEADAPLQALCHDWWLADEEFELESEGEARVARLAMNFTATVLTPRGNPETKA